MSLVNNSNKISVSGYLLAAFIGGASVGAAGVAYIYSVSLEGYVTVSKKCLEVKSPEICVQEKTNAPSP